jgi:hypothetical protein
MNCLNCDRPKGEHTLMGQWLCADLIHEYEEPEPDENPILHPGLPDDDPGGDPDSQIINEAVAKAHEAELRYANTGLTIDAEKAVAAGRVVRRLRGQ